MGQTHVFVVTNPGTVVIIIPVVVSPPGSTTVAWDAGVVSTADDSAVVPPVVLPTVVASFDVVTSPVVVSPGVVSPVAFVFPVLVSPVDMMDSVVGFADVMVFSAVVLSPSLLFLSTKACDAAGCVVSSMREHTHSVV